MILFFRTNGFYCCLSEIGWVCFFLKRVRWHLTKRKCHASNAYGIRYYSVVSRTSILTNKAFALLPITVIVPHNNNKEKFLSRHCERSVAV